MQLSLKQVLIDMTTKLITTIEVSSVMLFGMLLINFNIIAAEKQYLEANYYEAGLKYHDLTAGLSDWTEGYAKGSWQQDADNVWNWEVLGANRFDTAGIFFTGGLTHIFNDDWYGSLHLSTSDDAFYFPKYRVDAFINKKFLDEANLIGTLGLMYEDTRLINEESGLYLGATYYFSTPWVLEGGIRYNHSLPGPEYSTRYKIAISQGKSFERIITAVVDWGNEAYQYSGVILTTVDVRSTVYSLTWREWIKKDWGINVVAEYYNSETYDRTGVMFGVFKHF
jgi:YaiO family outer membrane protein